MAIQIIKQPSTDLINPAYNDSYISFNSTIANDFKAEIIIDGTQLFTIYPDLQGNYLLNLKPLVKGKYEGFEDLNTDNDDTNGRNIDGVLKSLRVNITVFNNVSVDTIELSYDFSRSVKQVGEDIYDNNLQVLSASVNGIDYNLTYFEGYPFTVDILKVEDDATLQVRNINTSTVSAPIFSIKDSSFRFYIDDSISNWTNNNYLGLPDTLNKLEILEDGQSKTNLNLLKIEPKCGVYLKWFNNQGGFNYWLFDEFYKSSIDTSTLSTIGRNTFNNVGEGIIAPTRLIGKQGSKQLNLKTRVDSKEQRVIESLYTSPLVQMYSATEPFQSGQWIDVTTKSKLETNNKPMKNKISVTIELPESILPTL
ncbi:hypothetical protein AAU57_08775 [Nonlabens sp. YIK11]|uniref:hypothetical protein n=1 Tax=Nonlabens sp. YIK11 TaxID=1453349 RepID=UPI0006DC2AF1|nr:hypothetical protein [Nonlabens sp. YIK11]KQC33396.1 hypothetical protein AAU57_08775 [Nonlabens sp. YIK11]